MNLEQVDCPVLDIIQGKPHKGFPYNFSKIELLY